MHRAGFVSSLPTPKGDGAFEAFFYGFKKMNSYQKYESLKAEWVKANPDATNQEYEAAMRRIASQCGV